jgi:hypothetical protein
VVDGDRDGEVLLPGLSAIGEVLDAILDPFHGPADLDGGRRQRDVFAGDLALRTKGAADVVSLDRGVVILAEEAESEEVDPEDRGPVLAELRSHARRVLTSQLPGVVPDELPCCSHETATPLRIGDEAPQRGQRRPLARKRGDRPSQEMA